MSENLVNELIQIYKDGMICNITEDGVENTYKAFEFLQDKISKKEKELDSYKRLIENLKNLWLGTEELDYDYEENPITNFEPFDFDYYVDNWFKCEALGEQE